MRTLLSVMAIFATGMVLTGCDWTSSGSDSSWSSRYEGVNFSGVYRGPNGGAVVTGVAAGTDGSVTVNNEVIGNYAGGQVNKQSNLQNSPIVPGSVTIDAPGVTFTDDGNGGLTGNAPNSSGSIVYSNGGWSISSTSFTGSGDIKVTYTYSTSGGGGVDSIKTLNVTQTGQHLTIIASSGAEFSGKMGGLSTSGVDEGTEEAIAEFSASAEYGGQKIRLVGTFRSLLIVNAADSDADSAEMTQRAISATWIEQGTGLSLDVNGFTGNTSVTLTP